jgi:type I restriction enzyme S subunit
MNAQRLLQHFNRIAEAPDAVPRLRRFILDLAVRGKLVEQDPGDEPAAELLKRIQTEKARLVKAGEIRKEKSLPLIEEDEAPYSPPTGWAWVRIRQVTSDRGQITPDKDFTYIDVTAINKEVGCVADANVLSPLDAPSRARKMVRAGDVLYSCVRPYLLNIAVIERDIVPSPIASTAFAVLNGFGLVLSKYLWIALRSPFMIECVEAKMRGQAYPAINDSDFAILPLPLPPLAEQHRIVAKVDELMALCDRLAAAQAERESRRDRVAAASLNGLNNGADGKSFREHACFHLRHLPRLTTSIEHIQQLRQTIRDLAVRGRLVRQDRNEEPAAKLLNRIAIEKAQLVKAGLIPRPKSTISTPKLTFQLPTNWQAIHLSDVCNLVTSGSRGWAEYYTNSGPKFIRAQNIRFGRLRVNDLACVNPPANSEGKRTQAKEGDLFIVITGAGVTNPARLDHDLGEAYVSQHVALIKPTTTTLSRWLLLCLMSGPGGRDELVERAYGAGKPGLNLDNVRSLSTPLPPLTEQQRIVAKVDQLMALCDQLEAQLTTAQGESRRLLEAVRHDGLAQALAEAT